MPETSTTKRTTIAIVGAGPAGLTLATALAERDLEVALISPAWPVPWPNNYGIWLDELTQADAMLHDCIAHRWDQVWFWGRQDGRCLRRSYVLLENHSVVERMAARFARAGGEVIVASARGARHDAASSRVEVDGAPDIIADLVIDATGHEPVLVHRAPSRHPGVQVAHGVLATLSAKSTPLEEMRLMDWRPATSSASPDEITSPTFLYAMPLGEDEDGQRVFFEETSLVARPALPIEVCEARLEARLAREGFVLAKTHHVERCFIPMGHPVPDMNQRVVGWGGAASMVHPATGYQMNRVLTWAPGVADAIAFALESGARGAPLSSASWQAIWTPERLQRRRFYTYGLETMLDFDLDGLSTFFHTFFDRPEHLWRGYLSGTASASEIARLMFGVFGGVSNDLRLELMKPAFGATAQDLVAGLLGTDRWGLGSRGRR